MMQTLLIAVAAGLAAALLFLAPASGSALAFPLFALTGLPLAIATFGWGVRAGAIAALSGAIVTFAVYPESAVSPAMFLCLFGVPVVWVAHLAGSPQPVGRGDTGLEWYPLPRVLLQIVVTASIAIVAAGIVSGYDPASLAKEAASALADIIAAMGPAGAPPAAGSVEAAVQAYVSVLPFFVGAALTMIFTFDLWAGGLVARSSGRMARWPQPIWTTELPAVLLPAFPVAVIFAFLPGVAGEVGRVASGTIFAGLVLVGLAVLHAVTRGRSSRVPVLVLVYLLLIFSGIPALLFAIVGAVDNFLRLRSRRPTLQPPSR